MHDWVGVQTFHVPESDDEDFVELDFCSPFHAAVYFLKQSKISPEDLVVLLTLVNGVNSPPSSGVPEWTVRQARRELATLQASVQDQEHFVVPGEPTPSWITELMSELESGPGGSSE
jgi:hypothetical protein